MPMKPSTDDSSAKRRKLPVSGLAFLIALAVLMVIAAAGLTAWSPYQRTQSLVNELEARNARLNVRYDRRDVVKELFGAAYGPRDRITAVDLSRTESTDADFETLTRLKHLKSLEVRGREITDEGLATLAQLKDLRSLMLVDCNKVSDAAVERLKRALPRLNVQRRGPAFLGVTGSPGASPSGCVLSGIQPDSAANRAGLRPGDVVTTVGGESIQNFEQLAAAVAEYKPGDTVVVAWKRNKTEFEQEVELNGWQRR